VSAFSWLERLAKRPRAAILLVALLAWLPGIVMLPPLDRDESRFAEASRQMVETGDFIDIRFADAPRYNKPAGIYWLQAGAAALVGPAMRGRIWVYRLPSLVGGLLSLLFLYEIARGIAPPATAFIASLLLGTSFLLTAESDIATTDAALLAATLAAEGVMLRVYLAAREPARTAPPLAAILAGWIGIGAGVLLKGPVILAVVGATAGALSLWDRDAKWLAGTKPLLGTLLAMALVAPWAIAIGVVSHGAFYHQSLGHDFASKIVGAEESHGAPPGYYLALANIAFWPSTLFLIPAVAVAIARRGDPAMRYLLCWSGAVWVLFELVPTKLPHYILPAWPPLALMAALWATRPQTRGERRWERGFRYLACVQFGLVAAALAAVCVFLPGRLGGAFGWPLLAGAAIGVAAAGAAVVAMLRRRVTAATLLAICSALAFYFLLAFGVVPQLQALWLSPRAAALVAANRRAHDPPVALAGYVEPSLVFLLGSDTRIEPAAAAATQRGLALVESRGAPAFIAALKSSGGSASARGTISGLDYSPGRRQTITLYRVAAPSSRDRGRLALKAVRARRRRSRGVFPA